MDATCSCVTAPCNCPTNLPGVSDISILGLSVNNTPTDSGSVIGGVNGWGPAPQDVPPGDTRAVTDGTATTGNPQSNPGVFSLLWNSITQKFAGGSFFGGQGVGGCRPDSWFCFGSGSAAYAQNPNLAPQNTSGNSLTTAIIFIVAGLFILFLLVRKLAP
jgi:hypothetical protein